MMSISIETPRLVLRSFHKDDAGQVALNSQQPNVAYWMSDMILVDEAEAESWIEWINGKCRSTQNMQVLAIERRQDGVCIGLIGFAPKKEIDGEVEILYAIADPYQGNGYATEAGRAIIWQAFEKVGLDMLSAIIKPSNTASRRVIEKLGFVYVNTRTLPYDGKMMEFDYYRLYHIETLPNPEWDFGILPDAEEMGNFFNRRADGYEAHMNEIGHDSKVYQRAMAALLQTDRQLKILDLGCGTGLELQYLFERIPNVRVCCMDLSDEMLAILRDHYQEYKDQLEIVRDSYLTWAYPDAAYDYVISVNTMHHLEEEAKTGLYRKIHRSLKPGGMYVESDFMVDRAMMEQYQARYKRITNGLPVCKSGHYHIDIPFTVEIQKELLFKAGFNEVKVFHENIRTRGSGAVLVAYKG